MKNSSALQTLTTAAALLLSGGTGFAQLSGGGVPGVSTAMLKLFGNISAFTARVDVRVVDATQAERVRMPLNFARLNDNLRVEVDLSQARSAELQPAALKGIKELGMDRVVSVLRSDKKTLLLVYPDAKSYVNQPLQKDEAEAVGQKLTVTKNLLGRETVDGHPCAKNQMLVKSGAKLVLNATTWNASDLNDFPVQVVTKENDLTSVMRFQQIQFARPDARQFDPPAGFASFNNQQTLLLARSTKLLNDRRK